MMDKRKRYAWFKRLLVIETIVCYMVVLTVISHVRGPVRYQSLEGIPLLETADFTSFAGESAEDGLHFQNDLQGEPIGYAAQISLRDIQGLSVSFFVDCPREYVNNILHIDLQADGYDNDEQEYFLTLKEGKAEVSFTLNPGISHPDSAILRFFTLDRAGYVIENIQIHQAEAMPKVSAVMIGVAVACVAVLAGTAGKLYRGRVQKSSETDQKT